MTANDTVQMTETILEHLVSADTGWRSVVRKMVGDCPRATPFELMFALTSTGSAIESMYRPDSPSYPAAQRAFRLAALLGADIYAAQELGVDIPDLKALHAYWLRYDDYFLTL